MEKCNKKFFHEHAIREFQNEFGERLNGEELIRYSELRIFFGRAFKIKRQEFHRALTALAGELGFERKKQGIKLAE